MKKVKQIVLLALGLLSINARSQQIEAIEIYGTAAPMFYTGQYVRTASESYNQTYESVLSREMGRTGLPFLAETGVRLWITENMGFCLNYSYSRFAMKAEFENDNSRHFTILDRTPIDFGLVFGKIGKSALQTRFGFCTSTMLSYLKYKDGTVNYSNLQPINGTFTTFGFFYRVDYSKSIAGPLRFNIGLGGASSLNSYYSDLGGMRDLDGASATWLPTNFEEYEKVVGNGNFYDYPDDEYWKMKYFMVFAGLQLNLVAYKK